MEATAGQTAERSVRWPDDFPGRDAARQDEACPRRAPGCEAEIAPAARRRVRPRGRRLRFSPRAAPRRCAKTWSAWRARDRSRGPPEARRRDRCGQPVRGAAELGLSARSMPTSRRTRSPRTTRDASPTEFRPVAERQVRRDLIIDPIAEREKLRRPRPSSMIGSPRSRPQRKASPSRSTRRSRRPDDCGRSNGVLPRRRFSIGSSRKTTSREAP